MAKFKKLAILCTALVMSAGLATAAACSEEAPSSSPSTESSSNASSSESTESTPEESSPEDSSPEDSSGGSTVETCTVTVNAPAGVTVGGTLTAEKGNDVVFTLTASENMFLDVSGAVYVSKEVSGDNVVYTYKVSAINRDRTVTVTQAFYRLVESSTVTVNNYQKVDLNLNLQPGTYVIKSSMEDATFGDENSENDRNPFNFIVTEDSTPNVYVKYFNLSVSKDTPVDVSYAIYELNAIDLTGTTAGSFTLLSGADIPVSFTAPAAGKYKIASPVENLKFKTSYADDGIITSSYVVELAENETLNLLISAESVGESFVFNYTVGLVEATPLALGETEVTLNSYEDTEFKFTADKAGDYTFTFVNGAAAEAIDPFLPEACVMFGYYDADAEYFFYNYMTSNTFTLAAGETMSVYAKFYSYDYANITDTISVTFAQSSLLTDANVVNVNENQVFRPDTEGYYLFTAGENEAISVDGGVTWVEEVELYVAEGEEVSIIAKSDVADATTATVTIESVSYSLSAYIGDNTFSLKADKEYSLELADASYYLEYSLTWDNDNVVVVDDEGNELSSGAKIQWFWQMLTLKTKDGAAVDSFTFTVTSESVAPGDGDEEENYDGLSALSVGANAINVENTFDGIFMTFTAETAGAYTLKIADGENNAWIDTATYNSNFGWMRGNALWSGEPFASYEFEMTKGETVVFWINTWSELPDEINLVVEAPEVPAFVAVDFALGENTIEIPAGQYAQGDAYGMGDYTVTWTGAATVYVNGVAIANGDVINFANPRTPNTLKIVPVDASAACTVVLTFAEYVEPNGLPLGSTEVTMPWEGFIQKEFTGKAGTYTITCSEGGVINGVDNGGYPDYNEITSFTLENDGDVFVFAVCSMSWDITSIVVTIEEGSGEPSGPVLPDSNENLVVGENTVWMIHEDGHSGLVHFIPEEDGVYSFSVEGAVVKLYDKASWAYKALVDGKFEAVAGTDYWMRVEPADAATVSVVVTIAKEAAAPAEVVATLGANAVAVPADKCVLATFTAEEDGKYRIKLADGENNAVIKVNGETITYPSEYELAAGDAVTFEVWSTSDADDTIDFVIEKYTEVGEEDDDKNWTQNY